VDTLERRGRDQRRRRGTQAWAFTSDRAILPQLAVV